MKFKHLSKTAKILQNEPCTIYTSSKKDISHIAIILNDDGSDDDEADETPAITPRRGAAAAATTTTTAASKTRVNTIQLFVFLLINCIQNDSSVPEESRQEYQKVLLRKLNEKAEARLISQDDKISSEK